MNIDRYLGNYLSCHALGDRLADVGHESRLEGALRHVVEQEGALQDQADTLSWRGLRIFSDGSHGTSPSRSRSCSPADTLCTKGSGCTSRRTTRSSTGVRLHPVANGHTKRLMADLQTLAEVPEWAERCREHRVGVAGGTLVVWSSAMRRGKTTQRERTKTTECKKPKEQLRAYSEQAACKGKGRGLRPPGLAAFTGAARGGQLEANVGRPGARVRSI